jgi:hypothetical protein
MPAKKDLLLIYLAFHENNCPRTELLNQDPQDDSKHLPVFKYAQSLDFLGDLWRQFISSATAAARMHTAC